MTKVTARLLSGFEDCDESEWEHLLVHSQTKSVFLTLPWQRAWWQTFGRGELLLIRAEVDGSTIAIGPLFADSGMIYFVGSGGSDYLDFIGDTSQPEALQSMLELARDHVQGFVGFCFYHIPDTSATARRLADVADRLNFDCFDEGDHAAPVLRFSAWPTSERPPTEKKSLLRHERGLHAQGQVVVRHFDRAEQICPLLPAFFDQHIRRWSPTPFPSLFLDQRQRDFFTCLTSYLDASGWLRFCTISVGDQPVAFHFGTCFEGTFLWYKPSFDVDWARHSPGEVLLRNLLLYAAESGAHTFDFGIGDEPFKRRFATEVPCVHNWGLYPRQSTNLRKVI